MEQIISVEFDEIEENQLYIDVANKVFQKCFEIENLLDKNLYINIVFTSPNKIHEINKKYRDVDRETDVLSFPMLSYPAPGDFSFLEDEENVDADCFDPESGELLLGDIVISTDHCRAQAVSYGHSVEREYAFLIAHSMLHLCGYDHESVQEEKEMFSLQEEILERLGILR